MQPQAALVTAMAIEAQWYRDEEKTLKADPHIQTMAHEIASAGLCSQLDKDEHGFMVSALQEYRKRSGETPQSIGGPIRAIRALLTDWGLF